MFYFKGCDKCKGDLHLEEDSYGQYFRCLQCGRFTEVRARTPGMAMTAARRVKKLAA